MAISLKPEHVKRYRDIAWLFVKYGRSEWVKQAGLDAVIDARERPNGEPPEGDRAENLADDLEKLGPTFIKLGQLLSTRPDIIPPAYIDALSRLQDHVDPFPFDDVERILTEELCTRPSRAFAHIDPKPLAAASLGQVHRATLRDGLDVAVKVQRPDIRPRIMADLEALDQLAEVLDRHTAAGRAARFQHVLAELRKVILEELDYRQEARNLSTLRDNLREFTRLVVPAPVDDYTTSRVLTMEYVGGVKITDVNPVLFTELDRRGLAEELFTAYLKQILVDGFSHADPHPGNVHLAHDGRIALLDVGMVARYPPGLQQDLLKLLLAISEGRGDDAADVAVRMGEPQADFDRAEYARRVADLVAQNRDAPLSRLQAGRIVMEIQRMGSDSGFRLPQTLTMLGKTLLNLDRVAGVLDPQFNPNEAIRRNALQIMQRRLLKNLAPGHLYHMVLESTDLILKLPNRLNAVMDAVANNKLKVKVDAIDEAHLIRGMHNIANRITAGLVLAALIVGAALLMRIETTFRILGYPGFAMILFVLAAAGGVFMLIEILFSDRRQEQELGSGKRR